MTYRVLDLFSGIGGFSLGLERTGGFETVAFCEIEEWPRRILAKHWPDVKQYTDVRELTYERLAADGIAVDVITAGFPCQDISTAGKGAGIEGERSGLWSEVARLTGELRPRYVILENVAALLGRGLDKVLADLAEIGYDAEWHCIPASHIGAPHRRDRFWCLAYASSEQRDGSDHYTRISARPEAAPESGNCGGAEVMAHADSPRLQGRAHTGSTGKIRARSQQFTKRCVDREQPAWTTEPRMGLLADGLSAGLSRSGWLAEPGIGRIASGVPDRTQKLKALGNSIVPQMATLIGQAIIEMEQGND